MSKQLMNFIATLGENPEQRHAFNEQPRAVMEEFGLSGAEMSLISSGEMAGLHRKGDAGGDQPRMWIV